MNRSLAFALTMASGLALSSTALTASAQATAAPAAPAGPAKIAVVEFQAAVTETNEFQRNFADLQKKFGPKRDQLTKSRDDIASMEKQLQAQGDKLSPAEQATRARTIEEKKKQIQRDVEDAQNDYQQQMQETFAGVATKVGEVMTEYASKQGYTLVLDITQSQQQAPVVLWATPNANITKAVIDAYNVKSGVPAPPPPPAAPAAK